MTHPKPCPKCGSVLQWTAGARPVIHPTARKALAFACGAGGILLADYIPSPVGWIFAASLALGASWGLLRTRTES